MKKIIVSLLLGLAIVAGIFAFRLAASFLTKDLIVEQMNRYVNTGLEVSGIRIDPLRGNIRLSGVKLLSPAGFKEKYALTLDEGRMSIDLLPLLFKRIRIRRITLIEPKIYLEIDRTSSVNMAGIIKTSPAKAGKEAAADTGGPSGKPAGTLVIGEISVKKGMFTLTDYKRNPNGAKITLSDISLEAENLTNASASSTPASLKGLAEIASGPSAGTVTLNGNGGFLSQAKDFDVSLKAENVSAAVFAPFYIMNSPVYANGGFLDMSSTIRCRNNQLNGMQDVDIKGLKLAVTERSASAANIFGFSIEKIVDYFSGHEGNIGFNFRITGTLDKPRMDIASAIEGAIIKSVGKSMIKDLISAPEDVIKSAGSGEALDKIGESADKIKSIGKDLLKNILGTE
ncbi:MAG: DUF748 domain-containing protein [Candidatus Omnitrophota bacterium]